MLAAKRADMAGLEVQLRALEVKAAEQQEVYNEMKVGHRAVSSTRYRVHVARLPPPGDLH